MSNRIITIETAQQPFPAGTVSGGIKFSITGGTLEFTPQTLTAAPYTITIPTPAAGTYSVTAQTVDSSGNPLGSPALGSFTIDPDVLVDIPQTITITVG